MTRTGARVSVLDEALVRAGLTRTARSAAPRLPDLPASTRADILDLYHSLGGLAPEPLFRPGPWDLSYGEVIVELDEDFHFNRYRALTLLAPFASALPWAVDYQRHSAEHEQRSGTGGRRWTNPSAERMFGPADAEMVFLSGGAPRWKQRALYDAVKDAAAATGVVRLARLSIYDHVEGVRLEALLRGRAVVTAEALYSFVAARSSAALT
ncbi:hypothetical protein [Curtobacterium sp. MCBA15_004]|uniref:DUF7255 family protein n=1 Tax=unclassified Curtobacterium TaxID=257496 RepID=UPI0008DD268A|nr:hypothetical protein [Curtobacterium sp. MCBA15_004]WIA97994.1 hypothetical protein QOL16_06305 [Curtobacterium sp. MCBA15_004]